MPKQAAVENSIIVRWPPGLLTRLCEQIFSEPNPQEQPRESRGLLLGMVHRNKNWVQILLQEFVPISNGYQVGPGEQPWEAGEPALRQALAMQEPHLPCIGFYRSHLRPELELNQSDLQLAKKYLWELPGIFLLVNKAVANGPQGRVFLFSGRQFSNNPSFVELPQNFSAGSPHAVRFPATPERAGRKTFTALSASLASVRKGTLRWVACALILLIAGLFITLNRGSHASTSTRETRTRVPQQSKLGLRASVQRDHVRIAWNPNAPSVAGKSKGTLFVTDGLFHNTIPLSKAVLAHGSVVYHPLTDAALFELRVGEATEMFAVTGLDELAKATPSFAAPADSPKKITGSEKSQESDLITGKTISSQISESENDSTSTRPSYKAPPVSRPAIQAPELLQPPDLGVVANPGLQIGVHLPVPSTPLPPPVPQPRRSETTAPKPSTPEPPTPEPRAHVEFVAARPIRQVAPHAPGNVLRLLNSSVTIRVQVHIDTQGRVVRAEAQPHGGLVNDYLSRLSVTAAREWHFAPARREGHEVESDTVLEFVFDKEGN